MVFESFRRFTMVFESFTLVLSVLRASESSEAYGDTNGKELTPRFDCECSVHRSLFLHDCGR
jgi:hypothetical protein